jgi:hypothetical protein
MIKGKFHWNALFVPILLLGWIGALIAAIAGCVYSLSQTHIAAPKQAPVTYSPEWIGMLCAGIFCMMGTMALEHIERNLERLTPKNCLISKEHKPSEVPLWV